MAEAFFRQFLEHGIGIFELRTAFSSTAPCNKKPTAKLVDAPGHALAGHFDVTGNTDALMRVGIVSIPTLSRAGCTPPFAPGSAFDVLPRSPAGATARKPRIRHFRAGLPPRGRSAAVSAAICGLVSSRSSSSALRLRFAPRRPPAMEGARPDETG